MFVLFQKEAGINEIRWCPNFQWLHLQPPWSKVKTGKKVLEQLTALFTTEHSPADWATIHRSLTTARFPRSSGKYRPWAVPWVGPPGPGQNCPAITSTSLKSLKLQTKLKRNTKFFFVLVSKNSCKVPHPEIVNAIYSWANYVWMSISAPWWQTQTKDETGKLAEKA